MIYKLPNDRKALSPEIIDKVKKLKPDSKEWYIKFDDSLLDKKLYDDLLNNIELGIISPNTIQDKKYLEEKIAADERELLLMLSEPVEASASDIEIALEKARSLSRQGAVTIRPKNRGNYPSNPSKPQKRRP